LCYRMCLFRATKRAEMKNSTDLSYQDRYLKCRHGRYHYYRRVPADVHQMDTRSPMIRFSLKTDDLDEARSKRDIFEDADNKFWASLLLGDNNQKAKNRYEAAVNRAKALGFGYRTVMDLTASPLNEIAQRIETAGLYNQADVPATVSLLGGVEKPKILVSEAKNIYFNEITPAKTVNKSADQKRRWSVKKNTSIQSFIDICGDKEVLSVSKEDANLFYRYWMEKIAPENSAPTHTASSGNSALSDLRSFYKAYMCCKGIIDFRNPFDGLGFRESKLRSRPPFPSEWILEKILSQGLCKDSTHKRAVLFLF